VSLNEVDWIELNEAFAAQALAVMQEVKLDPGKVNPVGGAIAWGHPLGATGAVRTATMVHGLQRTGGKYGMVTIQPSNPPPLTHTFLNGFKRWAEKL
jgi:acetyl-CoA acyltransferase